MEASNQTSAYEMHTGQLNHQESPAPTNKIKVTRISYHQTGNLSNEKRRISQFADSKSSGVSKANWQLALKNTEKKSNRYYKGEEMGMCTDVQHFKIYGPGVSLFFEFQKYLLITFSIMSIVALVPCIYNYAAGSVMSSSSQFTSLNYYFASTTLANFDSTSSKYKSMFKYVNAASGMINVLIFIVFYFFWLRKGSTLNEQIRNKIKLKSYYVLELTDFAAGVTQSQVQNFMGQFGGVVEVAAVKDYDETISLSKKIYQLEVQLKQIEIKKESQNSNQYNRQIKQKQDKIDEIYKQLVLYEDNIKEQTVKFFVTFSTIEEREKALKELQKHRKRLLDCCFDSTPENFKLRGQKVYAQPCHSEPTQIIWQNQHVNWSTRWVRVLIQYILLAVALVLGFMLVSLVNILTPPSASSIDTSLYTSTSILSVTNTTIVQSWCISNKVSVLQTSSSSAIYTFCQSYIMAYFLKILISLGISVSVFVVKFVMKEFVIFLTKFKRYKTQSEQSKDMVQSLFLVYTATTVLITFFLQATVFGISFKQFINNVVTNSYLLGNAGSLQQYSDFVANWYLQIGYQIAFNCMIMILHPALTMPFVNYFNEAFRYWRAQKQQVQANMQKKIQPQQFQIESNYAELLVIIFVGLSFSGGMPAITIIAFLAITTKYFYMRYIFYRYCKIPKTFDQALDNQIVNLLPFAVMIHFCFSIWMYGVSSIFQTEASLSINMGTSSIMTSVGFLFERVFGTWYYSIFFALFLVVWVFKTVFYNFIIKFFIEVQDDGSKIVPVAINADDFAKDMNPASILSNKTLCQSYKIQNNPDYVQVLQIMRKKRKFIVKVKNYPPEEEIL